MRQDIQQRKNLDEVSFIRPILIVLLVLYHAFAPWCGAWKSFDGYEPNEAYWWIGKAAYSFMLPMFVFISGYVWSYQREALNKKDALEQLLSKKFKRLYIPSLIFSIAYLAIFKGSVFIEIGGGGKSLITIVLDILSGYAHMWFLPMLFWIFLLMWCILQIDKRWLRWLIVVGLCGISFLPVPLGINTAFFYIIYFYAGYEALIYVDHLKKLSTSKAIIAQWLIFIIAFILLTKLDEKCVNYYSNKSILIKAIGLTTSNVISKVYGFLGISALYGTSVHYTDKHQLSSTVIKLGTYCFGVYLFQQFILQAVYYHTPISSIIGSQWLPWIGFIFALALSVLLSILFKHTYIGKKLI